MIEQQPDYQQPSVATVSNLGASAKELQNGSRIRLLSRALRRMRAWIPVLFAVAVFYAYSTFKQQLEQRLTSMENVNAEIVSSAAKKFRTELANSVDDLNMLSSLASLRAYLDAPQEAHRQSVNRDFVHFALAKRHYAQVRLLDVSGSSVQEVNAWVN